VIRNHAKPIGRASTPLVGTPAIAFVSAGIGLLARAALRRWMTARLADAARAQA
jgi:hypothetical protein